MCHAAKLPPEVAVMVKQEGRCQAWADRLNASAKKGLTKDKETKFQKLNQDESRRILEHINGESREENELMEVILQNPSQTRLILALKKAKNHYTKRRQTMMDDFEKKKRSSKTRRRSYRRSN